MSADRELLALAAKAVGIELNGAAMVPIYMGPDCWTYWNPLTDDGDALRLAVKLRLSIDQNPWQEGVHASVWMNQDWRVCCGEDTSDDPLAATRRAIVRAAAEIGRAM